MLEYRGAVSQLPIYDPWAIEQENVYAHGKRLRFIVQAVEDYRTRHGKTVEEVSILDVGCGTGIMITLPLASIGYRVAGIDIHRGSVEEARRMSPYTNLTFRHADPGVLLEARERYDIVIASEVLEHLAEPLGFLRVLRGLLRPGGMLTLTTPNGYGWFELEQWLWDELGAGSAVLWWNRQWTLFTQFLKAPIKRAIGWKPRPAQPEPAWEHLESTNNMESPHLQRFRWTRLMTLVSLAGMRVVRKGRGSLFCGKITHFYLRNWRRFIALNARVTDLLPLAFSAGWYLVLEVDPERPRILCLSDSGLMGQAAAQLEAHLGARPARLHSFRELRQRPGYTLSLPLRRFDAAYGFLTDVNAPLYRDFIIAYLFSLRAGRKALWDVQGRELSIGFRDGITAVGRCLADLAGLPLLYGYGRWKAGQFSRRGPVGSRRPPAVRRVAYLRANLWQETTAGGSVAHAGGVLSGLKAAGVEVRYVGTTRFEPARHLGVPVHVIPPRLSWMRNLPDLSFLAYCELFARRARAALASVRPDFVYQRYSVLNYSGLQVARTFRCPFILEYNGSEVWVARHWGTPLMFEGLATRIEEANLLSADLVVVVSRALRDEVVGRGVPAERVLVNPNAVDPDRCRPDLDGGPIRRRFGLEDKLVIGFIGTFGPWHGADVLAHAVRPVVAQLPAAHFLFIGDGSGMPRVREILRTAGVEDHVTLAGLVPQDEAPHYLAACDILVSPHVGNPDGSPFFGSPTKLFEYMAMGRAIVASDLDQIGEILRHGKTAWLVKPGDPNHLAAGILTLAGDVDLQCALGKAARAEAVAQHTWQAHVGRILQRMVDLKLINSAGPAPAEPV